MRVALRESVLRRSAVMLTTDGSAALEIALFLFPDIKSLRALSAILAETTQHGLDAVLVELRSHWELADLVRGWLDTPTWTASRDFMRQHPTLAIDPRVAAFLQALPDDRPTGQHLAILQLAETMPLDDVYDAVIDPTMAADLAMAAVETGNAPRIKALRQAAPALADIPFVRPYLAAVVTVLTGTSGEGAPDPASLIGEAAAQGTDTQRQAGAARLRRLARRRPDSAAALEALAAALLTPPAPADQDPEPASDAG